MAGGIDNGFGVAASQEATVERERADWRCGVSPIEPCAAPAALAERCKFAVQEREISELPLHFQGSTSGKGRFSIRFFDDLRVSAGAASREVESRSDSVTSITSRHEDSEEKSPTDSSRAGVRAGQDAR